MLQDNTDGHLAEEAQIPEVFNEIDANGDPESSWIRNIVNFKLYDSNMQPVSFSELGEGKPLATLVGEVVVPLSSELKQRIIESTCTVAQQLIPDTFTQVGNADVQISATTGSAPPVLAPWFDTELFYEQV